METGWAALAVPGEKEQRHGNVAPLTTGRREEEAVLGFYEGGETLFPTASCLTYRRWLRARKLHSPHLLVVFNEGREHK